MQTGEPYGRVGSELTARIWVNIPHTTPSMNHNTIDQVHLLMSSSDLLMIMDSVGVY